MSLRRVTGGLFVGAFVTAEVTGLPRGEPMHRLIVTYVALGFAAQTLIGVSVLRTGLLSAWNGWAAIGWNIGAPIVLVLVSRGDMYIPLVHHVIRW